MKFILGKKLEMTQKFNEDGTVVPVTAVLVEPCTVVQLKTKEVDGYVAVQIGCGSKNKINKAESGYMKDFGKFTHLMEFRLDDDVNPEFNPGDKIDSNIFKVGEKVKVSATSKGKGFQGVVKRHRFAGSLATHGHKDQLRMPGSIGATGPARVFKGVRMPGRMGGERVTVKNLQIIEINKDKNILFIKGAVPGARNGLVELIVS